MKKTRQVKRRPRLWPRGLRPMLAGLAALDFLERSRDMADDPVTAAPRPLEPWVPVEEVPATS